MTTVSGRYDCKYADQLIIKNNYHMNEYTSTLQ